MKENLIQLLALKPIHLDSEDQKHHKTDQSEQGLKVEKKQKHGHLVQWDIGGLGWDFKET